MKKTALLFKAARNFLISYYYFVDCYYYLAVCYFSVDFAYFVDFVDFVDFGFDFDYYPFFHLLSLNISN